MPEEATGAPDEQGTPDEAAPEGTPAEGQAAPAFDPEQYVERDRYENLRADYNRRNEGYQLYDALYGEAADAEARDQVFRAIAEDMGYDVSDLDELEYEEPQEAPQDPRVDQLLERVQVEEQERYLDSLEEQVEDQIDTLAEKAGLDLYDDEVDLIFAALVRDDDGNPDVSKAFAKVTGLREATIKAYASGKRSAPQAPSGSSASHSPDLDDREQRRAWMAQRYSEMEGG